MGGYPSNKEYRRVVLAAIKSGKWWYKEASSKAHPAGTLYCQDGDCHKSVYSTPKNPEARARQLKRDMRRCPHGNAITV